MYSNPKLAPHWPEVLFWSMCVSRDPKGCYYSTTV